MTTVYDHLTVGGTKLFVRAEIEPAEPDVGMAEGFALVGVQLDDALGRDITGLLEELGALDTLETIVSNQFDFHAWAEDRAQPEKGD